MYISPRIQLNIYTVGWWYKIGFKELTHFEETFSSAILFLMSLFNNREFPNGNPIRFVWSFVSMETKRWKGYKIVISTFRGNSHIRIFVPNWKLRTNFYTLGCYLNSKYVFSILSVQQIHKYSLLVLKSQENLVWYCIILIIPFILSRQIVEMKSWSINKTKWS